jgi:RNA polymerase sigma factor (sigma-70 family)
MRYDSRIKQKIEQAAMAYLEKPSDENATAVIALSLDYVVGMLTKGKNSIIEEDERQEIRLGIYEALLRFNPEKGKFTTWVLWWARRRFYRYKGRDYLSMSQTVRELLMYINRHKDEDLSLEFLTKKFRCSKNAVTSALALYEMKRLDIDAFPQDTSYDDQGDPSDDSALHTPDSAKLVEDRLFLQKAFDILDNEDRELIQALYYKNYTIAQLAREKGISSGEVLARRNACLEKMRAILEEEIA